MLDIGGWEFLVVAFVLIMVVGPKELPRMLRSFTQFTRQMRKMAREFTDGMNQIATDAEVAELKKAMDKAKDGDLGYPVRPCRAEQHRRVASGAGGGCDDQVREAREGQIPPEDDLRSEDGANAVGLDEPPEGEVQMEGARDVAHAAQAEEGNAQMFHLDEELESKQMKLNQQLIMTPQLQQAIKLLQLSHTELEELIEQTLVENPVLEEGMDIDSFPNRETPAAEENPETPEVASGTEDFESAREVEKEEIDQQDIDWQQYVEQVDQLGGYQSTRIRPGTGGDDEAPSLEATLAQSETLSDHLHWQMGMQDLLPLEFKIGV